MLTTSEVKKLLRAGWSFSKTSRYWKAGAHLGEQVWEISKVGKGLLAWSVIRVTEEADRMIKDVIESYRA
jgi:hypothetical protein